MDGDDRSAAAASPAPGGEAIHVSIGPPARAPRRTASRGWANSRCHAVPNEWLSRGRVDSVAAGGGRSPVDAHQLHRRGRRASRARTTVQRHGERSRGSWLGPRTRSASGRAVDAGRPIARSISHRARQARPRSVTTATIVEASCQIGPVRRDHPAVQVGVGPVADRAIELRPTANERWALPSAGADQQLGAAVVERLRVDDPEGGDPSSVGRVGGATAPPAASSTRPARPGERAVRRRRPPRSPAAAGGRARRPDRRRTRSRARSGAS